MKNTYLLKIFTALFSLFFFISLKAQVKYIPIKPLKKWKAPIASQKKQNVKKILMDINLNYFSVSETTRRLIDNGDCKRVFGVIKLELWSLDNNNEKQARIYAYNRDNEVLYYQKETAAPPPIARSYYQDPIPTRPGIMNTVTYNIPEDLLNKKKVLLVVKTQLGTRHKDNDFASYDFLCMEREKKSTFLLSNRKLIPISIKVNTAQNHSGRDLHINDIFIPFAAFRNTDDTHFIWAQIDCVKK